MKTPKTITEAANMLQSIREDRVGSQDVASLVARLDIVGSWLASQKKQTAKLSKLLNECHQLFDVLKGGSGKAGNRIEIIN